MEKAEKTPKKRAKTTKKVAKTPEVTEEKVRKIHLSSRRSFMSTKDYLERLGADFDYVTSGNVNRIIYDKREFIWVDKEESGGKGHHLNRAFMADVEAYVAKNKKKMKFYGNDYTEQMFNLQGIKKNIGKELTMIDVNNCYWRTAYKLGYITELTYVKGLRNKRWKIGRNACIGALIKTKIIQGYTKGKPDPAKRRVVRTPPEYHSIRNHIIGHIYKMFKYLFDTMGDNFCMFLTDCIVTTYDKKRQVEKFFSEEGYRTKSKPVEFTGIEENTARKGGKISWYDVSAKVENDGVLTGEHGVNRYYMYAQNQVVRSNQIG